MNNKNIEDFFLDSGLSDSVEKIERYPNVIWVFSCGLHQMMIQTQENANRMRIVAFIAHEADLDQAELYKLMEANYHSALDARYALTDGQLVSLFLHPFEELTATQFVLGLFQTITCAKTFGTSYSGGTMIFGAHHNRSDVNAFENTTQDILQAVVNSIR